MRSTVFFCAAVASIGFVLVGAPRTAGAADPKSKPAAKKSSGDADDKGISKTLQWEDKVMGPDDKRSELDKILKAQAINKAATEKAAREKEKADKEAAAREAKEAAAPKAQTTKRGGEVALPTLPDEDQGKSSKGKSVDISPKLDTAAAAAPPPPSKPADDKFIDKLLKEEGSGKRKKASASDDKALLDLLATEKPGKPAAKAKGKGAKGDGVDSILQDADKEPVMATPKIKHETPEWQKPEIQATSTPAPAVVKPVPRRDDGVIHVVQGAATPAGRPTAPATRPTPPARPMQASTVSSSRRQTGAAPAARGGSWNDPFADAPRKTARQSRDLDAEEAPPPRRNAVAVRQARDDDDDFAAPRRKNVASRATRDDDDEAPPARRNASASAPAAKPTRAAVSRSSRSSGGDDAWDDPFDKKAPASSHRATAPAAKPAPRGGAWKDPFTDAPAAKPARGTVAMRDNGSGKDEAPSKWQAASKRGSSADESGASDPTASSKGRWGILKKR
jgi:hypothetical protein